MTKINVPFASFVREFFEIHDSSVGIVTMLQTGRQWFDLQHQRVFLLPDCKQTSSGIHTASFSMETWDLFLGDKAAKV
jgi:hypothetical protein